MRLECDAARAAQGIVRARVGWLQYTLTMFSAVGRLNYLSGASRRRAVYSAVSGGFAAYLPFFDAVLGGLLGGTSSAWRLAQISVVSIIVIVITVIVLVIITVG